MARARTSAELDRGIVVEGLSAGYGDHEVLAGLDLSIAPGELFGLLGPNGAGKTTLAETIAGLRRPRLGSVRVAGLDPSRAREEITSVLAVQPQASALFPTLTARETLALFASFHTDPVRPDEVLRTVGLAGAAATRVGRLSVGQRQRLLIGVALVGRPRVLVLDEPSAALDPAGRRELRGLIRSLRDEGSTVLLTTHHLDEAAELCDRIGVLSEGRLVALGSPDELTRRFSGLAEVVFSIPDEVGARDRLAAALGGEQPASPTAPAAPAPPLIAAPPRIETIGDRLVVRVSCADPDAVLRAVTFARSLRASGLTTRRGTLEEAYLRLTGAPRSEG